jgi:hypothetical protein
MSTTRRSLIAGAPAVAAAALAGGTAVNALAIAEAKADEVDPIFEVIERHRSAWRVFEGRCTALDEAGTAEASAEWHRIYGVVEDAVSDMADANFTTMKGGVALLRYVQALDADGYLWPDYLSEDDPEDDPGYPWPYYFHRALADTQLEQIRRAA